MRERPALWQWVFSSQLTAEQSLGSLNRPYFFGTKRRRSFISRRKRRPPSTGRAAYRPAVFYAASDHRTSNNREKWPPVRWLAVLGIDLAGH